MLLHQFKQFVLYVLPSVLAFALSGVYSIADGFFVGHSIGDLGLSAINISYPVVTLIQSVGIGIGMGGAVFYSIMYGMGEKKEGDAYLNAMIYLLVLSGILATGILYLTKEQILSFLGAEGQLFVLGSDYLQVVILGAMFQILSTGFLPLIRNLGGTKFAMMAMILGFVTNIVLDYFFIWKWSLGTEGAALATVIGQGVAAVCGIYYIWKHKGKEIHIFLLDIKKHMKILKIGLAPFGQNLSPMVSLILINRYSILYGGENAVACYACIMYIIYILSMLTQGVGDGSQPLMSQCFGEKKMKKLKQTRFFAYLCAASIILVGSLIIYLLREKIGVLFGASQVVSGMVGTVMPIFLFSTLFQFYTRITASGFYATNHGLFSYLLIYLEPPLLFGLLMFLTPRGGQGAVWWSVVFVQMSLMFLAGILKMVSDKKLDVLQD